jgi:hypothetical protein
MKTLYITFILLVAAQLSANELSWVDEQVEAIKPPRSGISNKDIAKIKDPFIYLIKNEKKSKDKKNLKKAIIHPHYVKKRYTRRFTLDAILNKSAMIDGRWYKEGNKVHGYKLYKVKNKSIVLMQNNHKILLTTTSKNKNLKFNNK